MDGRVADEMVTDIAKIHSMFDSVCITRQSQIGAPIDLGFLAEAMIFYRNVHVVADRGMLTYLLHTCGPDSLKAAVSEGFLKLSFLENMLGVQTISDSVGSKRHRLSFVSSPSVRLEPYVERELFRVTGKRGKSRRTANSLGRLVGKLDIETPVAQAAAADVYDEEFCGAASKAVLAHIAPGYTIPEAPFFRAVPRGDTLHVETNFDLREANEYYRRLVPDAQPLGEEKILIDIFNAGADLRLCAGFSAEMAVSPQTSAIAQIRLSYLLKRRHTSNASVAAFQEWVFDSGKAIQEAVNAHDRNFDDVLKIASQARKFKEWIADKPDDSNLAKEYLRDVCQLEWIDQLPAKSLRWFLFNVVPAVLATFGVPAPVVAGLAVSLGDSFFVDKLAKGWKPNQFIEGPLRQFISTDFRG